MINGRRQKEKGQRRLADRTGAFIALALPFLASGLLAQSADEPAAEIRHESSGNKGEKKAEVNPLPQTILVPELKSYPLDKEPPSYSLAKLRQASGLDHLAAAAEVLLAPKITAIGAGFSIAGEGDLVLVQGEREGQGQGTTTPHELLVFRPGALHGDGEAQLRELEYVGRVAALAIETPAQSANWPALPSVADSSADLYVHPSADSSAETQAPGRWLVVKKTLGVIRRGDVVIDKTSVPPNWFVTAQETSGYERLGSTGEPKVRLANSPASVQGAIVSLFADRKWGARLSTLLINRGTDAGLKEGMRVLLIADEVGAQPSGEAVVYAGAAEFSQALVLAFSEPLSVGFRVVGSATPLAAD